MGSVSISFENTDQLTIEAVEAKLVEIEGAVITELDVQDTLTVSWIVENELHGQVLKQRSGKLAGSIRMIPAVKSGTSIVGQVEGAGSSAWYGALFENGGTGPFEIRPVRAKALRFVTDAGEVVFAKAVHHPGIPSRPFMAPAQEARTPEIVAGVQEAISEVLAK